MKERWWGGIFPISAVGNNLPVWLCAHPAAPVFASLLTSFATDYVARFKVGGTHLNFFIAEQLAVLPPATFTALCPWSPAQTLQDWLLPRVLELAYTARDLAPFAQDCGFSGPPFRWNEERRFLLRCELDAAFFHLYLPARPDGSWAQARNETPAQLRALAEAFPTPRHAVAHIMESFPIVQRRDMNAHGEYRTKRVILEIYDALLLAQSTDHPYPTRLDPPPADARCRHAE